MDLVFKRGEQTKGLRSFERETDPNGGRDI